MSYHGYSIKNVYVGEEEFVYLLSPHSPRVLIKVYPPPLPFLNNILAHTFPILKWNHKPQ